MFHVPAHKSGTAGQVSGAPCAHYLHGYQTSNGRRICGGCLEPLAPLLHVRLGHLGPIVEIIDVPAPAPKLFDTCSFVMAFEAGELDEDEIVEGFQHLIDSGVVWSLQGSYGRTAAALIEGGHCLPAAR